MIKIEIKDAVAQNFTSKKTGKPYFKQVAWAHVVDRNNKPEPYPTRIMLFLNTNEQGQPIPHDVGEYKLMPSSLSVGQFGDLQIGFVNLEPLKKAS